MTTKTSYEPTSPTYTEAQIREAFDNVLKGLRKVTHHLIVDLDVEAGARTLRMMETRLKLEVKAARNDELNELKRKAKTDWDELRAEIVEYVNTTPAG